MKELARRAKAATMALGRERAKTAQLTSEVAQLKREQVASGAGASCAGGSGAGGSGAGASAACVSGVGACDAAARLEAASARVAEAREGEGGTLAARERELREVKERLHATSTRLHEARTAAIASKAELGRYQRALARAESHATR